MHLSQWKTALILLAGLLTAFSALAELGYEGEKYLERALRATRAWCATTPGKCSADGFEGVGDAKRLREAYQYWEITLKKDDYLMRKGADARKKTPIRHYYEEFCRTAYFALLRVNQKEGMVCARRLGESKMAKYLLEEIEQEKKSAASHQEPDHDSKTQTLLTPKWVLGEIRKAQELNCQEGVDQLRFLHRELAQDKLANKEAVLEQISQIILDCEGERERKRASEERKKAKRERENQWLTKSFDDLIRHGLYEDAFEKAVAIDDKNSQDTRESLRTCMDYKAGSENKKLEIEARESKHLQIKQVIRQRIRLAKLQGGEKALALVQKKILEEAETELKIALSKEKEQEAKLSKADEADKAVWQEEARDAKQARETAQQALASTRQVLSQLDELDEQQVQPRTTKKWSELDEDCQEKVQGAKVSRQFCLAHHERIPFISRQIQERCLLIIGANKHAGRIDKIQTLQGMPFYIETDFRGNQRAAVHSPHLVADMIRLKGMETIESYGGRMSPNNSMRIMFTIRTKSEGKGKISLRVDMEVMAKDPVSGRVGRMYPKNDKHISKMYFLDPPLDPQQAQSVSVDLCMQLLSHFMAYLTTK